LMGIVNVGNPVVFHIPSSASLSKTSFSLGINLCATVRSLSIFLLGLALVYPTNHHVTHSLVSCSPVSRSHRWTGTSQPLFLLFLSFHEQVRHIMSKRSLRTYRDPITKSQTLSCFPDVSCVSGSLVLIQLSKVGDVPKVQESMTICCRKLICIV